MGVFRRAPGFACAAALTLAAGIAVVVAMFSVFSRAVLHPVTAAGAERLVSVYAANRKISFVPPAVSWPRYEVLRDRTTAFSEIGASSLESVTVSGAADRPPEQLRALRVTASFFAALRTAPAHGRLFAAEDEVPNGPAVCVLSWEFWQSHFGGGAAVGTNLRLNGIPTEIVGILPPRFTAPGRTGRSSYRACTKIRPCPCSRS